MVAGAAAQGDFGETSPGSQVARGCLDQQISWMHSCAAVASELILTKQPEANRKLEFPTTSAWQQGNQPKVPTLGATTPVVVRGLGGSSYGCLRRHLSGALGDTRRDPKLHQPPKKWEISILSEQGLAGRAAALGGGRNSGGVRVATS